MENREQRRQKKRLERLQKDEHKIMRSISLFDAKFGGINNKRGKHKTPWLANKCSRGY